MRGPPVVSSGSRARYGYGLLVELDEDESGCELLLLVELLAPLLLPLVPLAPLAPLPSLELLPLLEPELGNSEPPVAELRLTPK